MAEAATMSSMGSAPAPVMDVVAPPNEKSEKTPDKIEHHENKTSEVDPLDQLVAEDQKSLKETVSKPQPAAEKPTKTKKLAPIADASHSGIGLAIIATAAIVLSLAAMATYAYIQTNK